MKSRILNAIARFGEASTGQIAAWIQEPTEEVAAVLHELHAAGMVSILPYSLQWILP